MHSLKNSDLFYESVQGQNSSLIGNRWYPSKVGLWTWNSKQEIRPSLADCFPNHSQSFILVIFMNSQDDFHLSLLSTKHQTLLSLSVSGCICILYKDYMFIIQENIETNVLSNSLLVKTSGIKNNNSQIQVYFLSYLKNKSEQPLSNSIKGNFTDTTYKKIHSLNVL